MQKTYVTKYVFAEIRPENVHFIKGYYLSVFLVVTSFFVLCFLLIDPYILFE